MPEPDHSVPVQRRLAAVLCADLSGYSRLMTEDEAATLRMLARFRRLAEQVIRHYGGRVANTAGDSLLVEFSSVTDALRAALDIQSRIAGANADVPEDRRAHYRMGLHVGEVSVRQGDLFGDTVNLAARLEGLAPEGAVCMSALAHQFAAGMPGITFTSSGAKQVKNFAVPVETFLAFAPPPEPNGIPTVHRRILFHLARRFQTICDQTLAAIVEPAGLAPVDYAALASLEDAGGLDAAGLARRMGLSRRAAQQTLRRLKERGLVSGSGERQVRELTDAGSAIRQRYKPEVVAAIERIVAPLSDNDRRVLHEMLARIIQAHEGDQSELPAPSRRAHPE